MDTIKVELICTACGAKGEGTCACDMPYISIALKKAIEAIIANPEKSDRAIAEETGVSHSTVFRARKSTGTKDVPVKKRKGLDGKTRKIPKPRDPAKQREAELKKQAKEAEKQAKKLAREQLQAERLQKLQAQAAERLAKQQEKITEKQRQEEEKKKLEQWLEESEYSPELKELLRGKKLAPSINSFVFEFGHLLMKHKVRLNELMRHSEYMNSYARKSLAHRLYELGDFFLECGKKLKNNEHTPDFENMKVIAFPTRSEEVH